MSDNDRKAKPELLAPAGQPDAGYAALHYGADAVYLGLNRFSARAEAVNFSPEELAEFAAYAHSLTPARKVYLTLNTLVKQDELAAAGETLLVAAECGVDAVIVQDLGVARLAREKFPGLHLHASTQMAVHNPEGAAAVRDLGFSRVTVARELTLDELRDLAMLDIEVESFIHGTLCYSYSGLCLFSSIATGRSGNRGRCVYSCREAAVTPAGRRHPFSLKDMALGERVLDLARAGVASLKIEGRKKSPLYVAATVDYYRRILDGKLHPDERGECEARLRTIFARPWTRLFLDGVRNPDAADTEVVGHRGSPLGEVERVASTPAGPAVVFRPNQPVERHDGLQVDLPGEARPYGFGVDNLYLLGKGGPEAVFAAPAGSTLAAALPADAPPLTPGLPLYLSSSQAVKRSYPFTRPKAGVFGLRLRFDADVSLSPAAGDSSSCRVACAASAVLPGFMDKNGAPATITAVIDGEAPAFPARDAAGAGQAARTAFERTGGSGFELAGWSFANPAGLFVRPGDWNRLRRELLAALEREYRNRLERRRREVVDSVSIALPPASTPSPDAALAWSVAVDSPADLEAFAAGDLEGMAEVVVGIGTSAQGDVSAALEKLTARIPRERIRLAVPLILRLDARRRTRDAVRELLAAGWRRWFASGLGALPLLAGADGVDIAADWPLYTMNRYAASQLLAMGFSSFTLSLEDEADNLRQLLRAYPREACLVVHSDLPLFISAACAHAHIGLCRRTVGPDGACGHPSGRGMKITMEKSGAAEIFPQNCGSVVIGAAPYSLVGRLDELRAMGAANVRVDLRWRPRTPDAAVAVWRRVRSASAMASTEGNFRRGLP